MITQRFNQNPEWRVPNAPFNTAYHGLNDMIKNVAITLDAHFPNEHKSMLEIGSYMGESTMMFAASHAFETIINAFNNSDKKILKNLENLLEGKYEPILVIQMLRVPPSEELRMFANQLMKDFGYKVLVLPGDFETKVELISVLKSDVMKTNDLQEKVLTLIEKLEEDNKEALEMVIGNTSEEELDEDSLIKQSVKKNIKST